MLCAFPLVQTAHTLLPRCPVWSSSWATSCWRRCCPHWEQKVPGWKRRQAGLLEPGCIRCTPPRALSPSLAPPPASADLKKRSKCVEICRLYMRHNMRKHEFNMFIPLSSLGVFSFLTDPALFFSKGFFRELPAFLCGTWGDPKHFKTFATTLFKHIWHFLFFRVLWLNLFPSDYNSWSGAQTLTSIMGESPSCRLLNMAA